MKSEFVTKVVYHRVSELAGFILTSSVDVNDKDAVAKGLSANHHVNLGSFISRCSESRYQGLLKRAQDLNKSRLVKENN